MQGVIFIGIPGAGKSSFYKDRFFRTHVRINLDMLKTRHRESVLFHACLSSRQSMVIDNTNVSKYHRQRYIPPLKHNGFKVTGYYFRSVLEECMSRNEQRPGKERIPDKGMKSMAAKLEQPQYAEGFDELFYVRITPEGGFQVSAWDT